MLQDSTSFGKVIHDLCEEISRELAKHNHDTLKLAAMDIGSGYHSYMFGIAKWQLKVLNQ